MIGDAQGAKTIANGVAQLAFSTGINMPSVGPIIGNYIRDLLTVSLTLNYGTYWAFGILLALAGFILVARGDRKPRDPKEREPLLSEPLYLKQES
jgi:hypothetical protein